MAKKNDEAPTLAYNKKGNMSAMDAIVRALWRTGPTNPWPERTFGEVTTIASQFVGYELAAPTVRSYVYRNPEIFDKVAAGRLGVPKWRLSHGLQCGKRPTKWTRTFPGAGMTEKVYSSQLSARKTKGRISVFEAIVRSLWKDDATQLWPERTFAEIHAIACKLVGFGIAPSSIRSQIYQRAEMFEQIRGRGWPPKWRVSEVARRRLKIVKRT
ncbi:MAG: hypothetical protein ABI474_09410 [Actinomycetota bacterium]